MTSCQTGLELITTVIRNSALQYCSNTRHGITVSVGSMPSETRKSAFTFRVIRACERGRPWLSVTQLRIYRSVLRVTDYLQRQYGQCTAARQFLVKQGTFSFVVSATRPKPTCPATSLQAIGHGPAPTVASVKSSVTSASLHVLSAVARANRYAYEDRIELPTYCLSVRLHDLAQ